MASKSKSAVKNNRKGTKRNTTLKQEPNANIQFKQVVRDERTKKILGFSFVLIAVFLGISFLSYFFTWTQDFAKADKGWSIVNDLSISVQNLMGKLGLLVAHTLINKYFGIGAILICTFFFVVGINLLFRRNVFSVTKNLKYVTIGTLILSVYAAFFLKKASFPWGGGVGNSIAGWFEQNLGYYGTIAVLVLLAVGYIIWQFNPMFSFPSKPLTKLKTDIFKEDAIDDLEDGEVINIEKEMVVDEIKTVEIIKPKSSNAKLIIDESSKNPNLDFQLNFKEDEEENQSVTVVKPTSNIVFNLENNEEEIAKEVPTPIADKKLENIESAASDLALEINSKPLTTTTAIEDISKATVHNKPYEPTLDLRDYQYPSLELLEAHGSEKIERNPQELEDNKNQIINTLRNYDIEIQKITATIGPTVTLYEIVPAAGVRISKIKNLEDDIALSLSALGIRIIAPIPGRGTIGIEVPNTKKTIVSMKALLASEQYQKSTFALPIALGKTIDNKNFIVDLATMPHLLMAGATGQGKSVGINAILVSLLYKKHPSQLKFVLVDPKKVELSIYSLIQNHFLAKLPNEDDAIITDTKKVINTLNALCIEMDNRYDLLKDAGCRNIKEYNAKFIARRLNPEKGHAFLPFIVLVIDEFADLIMTVGKEVEMPIARLAQLARAVGVHLVIATQRPSVNIITGIIKANFPARVAFKVSSKIDSRTILDAGGAEQLIGKGDMLISLNGEISRVQCAFVDTPEVDKVVESIGYQEGYPQPFLLPEYVDENDMEVRDFNSADRDALFEDAAKLIVANQIGSTSLIQRRMKLGYNRAGRLMDQLEAAGIVGPNQGSKPREVIIKTEADLQQLLNQMI